MRGESSSELVGGWRPWWWLQARLSLDCTACDHVCQILVTFLLYYGSQNICLNFLLFLDSSFSWYLLNSTNYGITILALAASSSLWLKRKCTFTENLLNADGWLGLGCGTYTNVRRKPGHKTCIILQAILLFRSRGVLWSAMSTLFGWTWRSFAIGYSMCPHK